MNRQFFIGGIFLLVTSANAFAQTKISGTLKCEKPEPAYRLEVGDRPGHVMVLEKLSCSWIKPMDMGGDKAKDASVIASVDVNSSRSSAIGTSVSTMESGDKTFTAFRDASGVNDGKRDPAHGTWSYSGGTAKFKGIKGKGTYTTTFNADGTSTVEVEGEYDVPKAKSVGGK